MWRRGFFGHGAEMISFSPAAAEHESTGWQSPPCMFLEPGNRGKVMRREDVICTDINCSPSFPSAAPAALCGRAACTGSFRTECRWAPVCVWRSCGRWRPVICIDIHCSRPSLLRPLQATAFGLGGYLIVGPFWGYFR